MWMTVRILETLDDPQINLGDTAIGNVPAWALDPEISAAYRAAAAKRECSVQSIKVLTSHHGAAHARRRIVIFMNGTGGPDSIPWAHRGSGSLAGTSRFINHPLPPRSDPRWAEG